MKHYVYSNFISLQEILQEIKLMLQRNNFTGVLSSFVCLFFIGKAVEVVQVWC